MARLSEAQKIAQLEAQIEKLKAQAVAKLTKRDPSLRYIKAAARHVASAMAATDDGPTRKALDEARATLSAVLSLNGAVDGGMLIPHRQDKIDREAVLAYVQAHSGQRGEEVAAGLGTTTTALRPVMRKLIEASKVRTVGQRRGMQYMPV